MSLALCKAGAAAAGVPLYRHLAALSGRADQQKLLLPVPCAPHAPSPPGKDLFEAGRHGHHEPVDWLTSNQL